MRAVAAICTKELRVYLTTWTSYVLFAAFLLISAFFFQRLVVEFWLQSTQLTEMNAQEYMAQLNLTDWVVAPLFMNITVFFLFLLPILTMRLLAEERKSKTLELLMTVPVAPWQIVLGKYLAAVLMMAMMLALTVVFPLLLQVFGGGGDPGPPGPIDWPSIGVAYLGLFLLGAAFVSVGLFASSLSDSQIVAVVISFAALLLFYVIGLAARGEEGPMQHVFEYLSVTGHLESFVRGLIRSSDVVYYLSMSFLGLFLTYRVVEAQRWR